MHLFLYQADRHQPRQGYYGRRLSQSTIRCDFDLELLKRGIKGRYQIIGHGKHDFQKALMRLDMERDFYGHIIAIDNPKNAVWFKLNYDQVGRYVTKYIGGWKDLEESDIEHLIQEYQELKKKKTTYERNLQSLRGHFYSLNSFLSRMEADLTMADLIEISGPLSLVLETGKTFRQEVTESEKKTGEICDLLSHKMMDVQNQVRSYMDSKKL